MICGFMLTVRNWLSLVAVSDGKTIGSISFQSPGEEYISSYFLRHINSDVGIKAYICKYHQSIGH